MFECVCFSFILLCYVFFCSHISETCKSRGTGDSKMPVGMNVSVNDCLSVNSVIGDLFRGYTVLDRLQDSATLFRANE